MDPAFPLLLAEDEPSTRLLWSARLTAWGYQVEAVADGLEALERLNSPEAPRLVLADWQMPRMDGMALCRALRQRKAGPPVHVVLGTGSAGEGLLVRALESGADDFVSKPYNEEELRSRLEVGRRHLDELNRLEQQSRLEGAWEVAGAVCHEMSQPLQIVLGYGEFLSQSSELSPGDRELLDKVTEGSRRLKVLIHRLQHITEVRRRPTSEGRRIWDLSDGEAGE